jgi:hypothetical protein
MCARCDAPRVKTMAVGHIEGNSGPGYEVRFCRACVLLVLAGARAEQARGHRPRVPAALEEALPTISIQELMRQTAEYEAPPIDPAEIAEGRARLLAYMEGRDAEAPG